MAKKKTPEDRLVTALAEILPPEKFQSLSYAFVKRLTNEAIVRKANKEPQEFDIEGRPLREKGRYVPA